MTYINDILVTLTEAKDALEKLPELRDEVRKEREGHLHTQSELRTATEANLKLQATIDELTAKVRSLEVERDDASFRELETAERLNAAKARLQAIIGSATDVLAEVEPKAAEVPETAQGTDTTVHESSLGVANSPEFIGEVKNNLGPFVQPSTVEGLTPAGDPGAGTTTTAGGYRQYEDREYEANIPEYKPQPYRGFRVWDRPGGISWEDFVNGGGEAPSWYVSRSA